MNPSLQHFFAKDRGHGEVHSPDRTKKSSECRKVPKHNAGDGRTRKTKPYVNLESPD